MTDFKFLQSNTLKRDFKITAPDESVITVKGIQFEYMEPNDYLERSRELGDEILFEIVTGWDGFEDGSGNDLEYSDEALEAISNVQFCKVAIFQNYVGAINGADLKNLNAPLAPGLGRSAARPLKVRGKKKGRKSKR